MKVNRFRLNFYFNLFWFIFLLSFFLLSEIFAETIWVADRGRVIGRERGQLFKVAPGGRKEEIKLKGFANPAWIEVDPRDGSVWVTDVTETFDNQLVKLSKDGDELFRLDGFVMLGDAALHTKDGSYFAVDRMIGEVIKISSDGKELFRIKNLSPVKDLEGMGCLKKSEGCHMDYQGMDVNLESIDDVDVSSIDDSIWVADTGQWRLLKFDKDGKKLTQKGSIGQPEHLDVAPDGSVWVNNIERGRIFKISEDGRKVLAKITGLDTPVEISVSPIDNTCWVTTRHEVIQISEDGKEILKRINSFYYLEGLSTINPKDGSFWVADPYSKEIIKISRQGEILKRIGGFIFPRFLEVYWSSSN